ncbi:MAG: LytTR family transcriptional regulator [Bacteroidales bacterium]|nr:LytTR family transcriptional regulator [Bacteroidales bacterium]MBP5675919.1 LytTR family transcriptional regulator [Bacteroidales bacterium]
MSATISRTFYKMPVITLFFIVVPVFYFLFVVWAEPFGMNEFLSVGKDRYTFNLIITTVILLGVMVLSRMLLFILRRVIDLNWPLYIFWCVGEVVFAGFMFSILLGIGWAGEKSYLSVLTQCVMSLAGILIYPLTITTMAVQMYHMHRSALAPTTADDKTLVRFLDSEKRLKLIVSSDAIYYIEAKENYVHIVHQDGIRIKDFRLRSSMTAIEDLVTKHGLVRCHRSFFVNPQHVALVRKDPAGYAMAQLSREGLPGVPVSKTYYDSLASLL